MVSRAEHRERTLRDLNLAAIEAIEEHGPDVALDVIAERAGVAKRTVYRWVDAKDDLLFVHPKLWLESFDKAVATCETAPLRDRIHTGAAAVCAAIDDDPDPVLRSFRLVMTHPQLIRGYTTVNQQWIERMAAEVRYGADHLDRFRARVIGAAIMGVIDAALFEWVDQPPPSSLGDLVSAGLRELEPLLAEERLAT